MKRLILLAIAASFSIGCLTMIRGTTEPLSVITDPEGATAKISSGQVCKTPCQVQLKRNQSAVITFEKEGCQKELASVFPTVSGVGIMLGGLIDYATGAIYDLQPNPVTVVLQCSESQPEHAPTEK